MQQATRTQDKSQGFTLIELVIAIAILVVIMSFAYSSLSSIVQSKNALDDGRDADMVANAVLTRLTRELSLAAISGKTSGSSGTSETLFPPCNLDDDNPKFPGVRLLGEKETQRSGIRGDSISFIASDAGQYLPDGGTHTGLVQINYRVVENEDKELDKEGLHVLMREEIPFLPSSATSNTARWKQVCKKAMTFPITNRLSNFSFEYFDRDSGKWLDSWSGTSLSSSPTLIRFSISLRSPKGVTRTYATSLPVR
jgi:prepilin-type N-terminal cleavage/methylation domain-containing protein